MTYPLQPSCNRFEFRVVNASHAADDKSDLVRQYVRLREKEYAKDGLPTIEDDRRYDAVSGTTLVIAIDKASGTVAGGGRLLVKEAGSEDVLPFESSQECRIENLLPGLDRKKACYGQIGGIVVAPEYAENYAGSTLGAHIQRILGEQAAAHQAEFCVSTVAARNYLNVRHSMMVGKIHLPLDEMRHDPNARYLKILDVAQIPGNDGKQVPVIHICYTISPGKQTRAMFHRACSNQEHFDREGKAFAAFKSAMREDEKANATKTEKRQRFRRSPDTSLTR